jgi:hypothetical protein
MEMASSVDAETGLGLGSLKGSTATGSSLGPRGKRRSVPSVPGRQMQIVSSTEGRDAPDRAVRREGKNLAFPALTANDVFLNPSVVGIRVGAGGARAALRGTPSSTSLTGG